MTNRARKILEKMKKQRVLDDFNQATLDVVGPVAGGDQGLKILKEMNELEDFRNDPLE